MEQGLAWISVMGSPNFKAAPMFASEHKVPPTSWLTLINWILT